MDKRRKPRQPRRLPCELWHEGARHTGILRDVSEIGLFVQTRLKANAGAELELVFKAEGERAEVRLLARVARAERLAAHFNSSGAGGLGLQILEGMTDLAPLLDEAGYEGAPAPAPPSEGNPVRPYRVKLRQIGGSRSQTLSVNAPSRQVARARALTRAKAGWKVVEVCEG